MKSRMIVRGLSALAAGLFVATAVAADAQPQKRRSTPEERRARRAALIAKAGGLVDRPIKGRVIRIKIETDAVAPSDLDQAVAQMRLHLGSAVEVVGKETASTNSIGVFVLLADKDAKDPAILCAPEDRWATLNVTKLKADKPSPELLKERVVKETWRTLAYAMGAGISPQQPCVMRPIYDVSDLDAHKVAIVSPTPLMAMKQVAGRLRLSPGGQATYERACEQGWAPEPTNDVQRAIWKRVHELPTKPLTIEPEKPAKK